MNQISMVLNLTNSLSTIAYNPLGPNHAQVRSSDIVLPKTFLKWEPGAELENALVKHIECLQNA